MSGPAGSRANLSDSVGDFAELVAAGTPTPGGGSVSAYCGVLAASLGQMMCNITIGKPKYAAVDTRLRELGAEFARLGARLRELIAEDAASFEAVLLAYRMPRESDEQKAERAARIQISLERAVDVPFETAQRSFEVLNLLREVGELGTPNALSDVAVGAQLAQVAVRGASYNVSVNLDSLTDREGADRIREEIGSIVHQATTLADQVVAMLKT